jgi:hypothetical protein
VQADARVATARQALSSPAASEDERRQAQERYEAVLADVEAEVQAAVGREFDAVHSVARAMEVGSLDAVLPTRDLRPALCARLASAVDRYLGTPLVPAVP